VKERDSAMTFLKEEYILRMVMEIAKEDNIKPVFSATFQNEQNTRRFV
jgi:hypothetical protein